MKRRSRRCAADASRLALRKLIEYTPAESRSGDVMNGQTKPGSPFGQKQALVTAVSAALAGAQGAYAQDAPPAGLEEIVVTATKRTASLQDVPVSITAFGGEEIEKHGFRGIDDYAAFVPSLSFATREPGGTAVVFRGVASSGLQFGGNSSSAIYLDEQPITSAGDNPDPRLVDIERIEALSGPQGTLFGASSQSGTLRIITNKPNTQERETWVELSTSSVSHGDIGYDVAGPYLLRIAQDPNSPGAVRNAVTRSLSKMSVNSSINAGDAFYVLSENYYKGVVQIEPDKRQPVADVIDAFVHRRVFDQVIPRHVIVEVMRAEHVSYRRKIGGHHADDA